MPRAAPVPVDVTIEDGDLLDLLEGATVVHVLGHTRGAIALHFPSQRLLICGDAIDHRGGAAGTAAEILHGGPGPGQVMASLHRLAELEFEVLAPGHGEPFTGSTDKQVRAMVQGL